MTAHELLTALVAVGCEPFRENDDIEVKRDVPRDLYPYVELLHTGVRAILSGRRWFGIDADGRGVGFGVGGEMSPFETIPDNAVLLTVEGARDSWDRIPQQVKLDFPKAFHKPAANIEKKKWTKASAK